MEAGSGAGYIHRSMSGQAPLAAIRPRSTLQDCCNAFPSHMLPVYMHGVQLGIPLAKNDPVAKQYLGQLLGKVETVSHSQVLCEVYTSQHMCRKYTAFVISLYVALCNIV